MIGICYKGCKNLWWSEYFSYVMLQYGKKHYQKEIEAIEMIGMFPQTKER